MWDQLEFTSKYVLDKDLFCVKMAGPKALATIVIYSNQLSLEIFD